MEGNIQIDESWKIKELWKRTSKFSNLRKTCLVLPVVIITICLRLDENDLTFCTVSNKDTDLRSEAWQAWFDHVLSNLLKDWLKKDWV